MVFIKFIVKLAKIEKSPQVLPVRVEGSVVSFGQAKSSVTPRFILVVREVPPLVPLLRRVKLTVLNTVLKI